MLETSRVTQQLAEAREFADKVGLRIHLEIRLTYLDTFASPRYTRCVLFPYPAPYSFAFAMERGAGSDEWSPWFDGALIYHGAHDRYGSGIYPTLPATPVMTMGWTIHR